MGSYPTGTPAAARHFNRGPTISFFLALTGGGLVPMRPAKRVARPKRQRFEQANRQAEADAFGGGPRQQGVAGGRAVSAPPLLKAADGAFRGRGVTTRRTRARASSLGGLRLGSTATATARAAAPPFWPRCRSAPLWGKGRRRRRCAAGLAHRRKRARNWEWTKSLAVRLP